MTQRELNRMTVDPLSLYWLNHSYTGYWRHINCILSYRGQERCLICTVVLLRLRGEV